LVTDPTDIQKIAKAMEQIIDYPIDHNKSMAFYQDHSPEQFLSILTSIEHPVCLKKQVPVNLEA
jgi:hypothetical protein